MIINRLKRGGLVLSLILPLILGNGCGTFDKAKKPFVGKKRISYSKFKKKALEVDKIKWLYEDTEEYNKKEIELKNKYFIDCPHHFEGKEGVEVCIPLIGESAVADSNADGVIDDKERKDMIYSYKWGTNTGIISLLHTLVLSTDKEGKPVEYTIYGVFKAQGGALFVGEPIIELEFIGYKDEYGIKRNLDLEFLASKEGKSLLNKMLESGAKGAGKAAGKSVF